MVYDQGGKVIFNEGVAITFRLDEIQKQITHCSMNPDAMNPVHGEFNYRVWLRLLTALQREISAHLDKKRTSKKAKEIDALIDTGASASYLRKDLADEIGAMIFPDSETKTRIGDGRKIKGVEGAAVIIIRNCPMKPSSINIIENCPEELVLGADFLQEHKANINMEDDKLKIKCPPRKMEMLI